jgi:hypothetical protein
VSDYKHVAKKCWYGHDTSDSWRSGSEGRRHEKRQMARSRRLADKTEEAETGDVCACGTGEPTLGNCPLYRHIRGMDAACQCCVQCRNECATAELEDEVMRAAEFEEPPPTRRGGGA